MPEELQRLAARLQAERTQAEPLELDQIKRRVITRCSTTQGRSTFMKSRLATIGTLVALAGGTGGAIAVGSSNNGNGVRASAAGGQYCQGKDRDDAYNEGYDAGSKRGRHDGSKRGDNVGRNRGSHRSHHAADATVAKVHPGCGEAYNQGYEHHFNHEFNRMFNRHFNRGFNSGWKARHGG